MGWRERIHVQKYNKLFYVLLNKPMLALCSTIDDLNRGRKTVYDILEENGMPRYLGIAGRLDYETTGLVFFSNDPVLNTALTASHFKGSADPALVAPLEKIYHLKVAGRFTDDHADLQKFRTPLEYKSPAGSAWTRPAYVCVLSTHETTREAGGEHLWWKHKGWTSMLEVRLTEGKNTQIRRLCTRSTIRLLHLHRARYGPLDLEKLDAGRTRRLTRSEVARLYARVLPADACPVHEEDMTTILSHVFSASTPTTTTTPATIATTAAAIITPTTTATVLTTPTSTTTSTTITATTTAFTTSTFVAPPTVASATVPASGVERLDAMGLAALVRSYCVVQGEQIVRTWSNSKTEKKRKKPSLG